MLRPEPDAFVVGGLILLSLILLLLLLLTSLVVVIIGIVIGRCTIVTAVNPNPAERDVGPRPVSYQRKFAVLSILLPRRIAAQFRMEPQFVGSDHAVFMMANPPRGICIIVCIIIVGGGGEGELANEFDEGHGGKCGGIGLI